MVTLYRSLGNLSSYVCSILAAYNEAPRQGGRTAMSSRRETRPAEARISKGETKSRNTRSGSQVHRGRVVGGILIVMASLWLGLLLLHHFGVGVAGPSSLALPGLAPTAPPTAPVSSLALARVSLGHPTRSPALTQQQALVIASQLEADAAMKAKKTN